jgi:hypothetical protein
MMRRNNIIIKPRGARRPDLIGVIEMSVKMSGQVAKDSDGRMELVA